MPAICAKGVRAGAVPWGRTKEKPTIISAMGGPVPDAGQRPAFVQLVDPRCGALAPRGSGAMDIRRVPHLG